MNIKRGTGRISTELKVKHTGNRRTEPGRDVMHEEEIPMSAGKPSPFLAQVAFRAGTTLSKNYQSVTCMIEVTLPVALDEPFSRSLSDESQRRINKAIAAASELATEAYEREAEELKQLLDEV